MNEFRIYGFRFHRYGIAALVLAFALLFAAATDYIPAFFDSEGRVFGLFHLDIYKDALHVASGLWAFASAWSRRIAVFFLRVFGTLYFADGIVGVFTGSGYLDLSIFIGGLAPSNLATIHGVKVIREVTDSNGVRGVLVETSRYAAFDTFVRELGRHPGASLLSIWFAGMACLAIAVRPDAVVAFGSPAAMTLAVAGSDGYLVGAGQFYVAAKTGPNTVRNLYSAGAWLVRPVIGKGCERR